VIKESGNMYQDIRRKHPPTFFCVMFSLWCLMTLNNTAMLM